MKKNIIGLIVFALFIAGGVGYYLYQQAAANSDQAEVDAKTAAKPKPLSITAFAGYDLATVDLEGEKVPLIRIPLVTWGGYAALIAANDGLKPSKNSLFYKKGKFAVELYREENSAVHLQSFASGKAPIIWSTMDMLPLIYNEFKNDKRVIPQVFGIFDWSFGGDGIIVRSGIKVPADLKGKRVVTSGNSPSHFFLMWLLAQANLKPSDVTILYVDDAIIAKDTFLKDQKIDACVTWSPFIYELTDPASKSYVKNSRLLITSKDANQLIADCFLTRLDFQKEHPEIVKAFSEAVLEGQSLYAQNQDRVYAAMASLFALPGGASEAKAMLGDVHLANFPETLMFFDMNNAISAYKIFYLAQEYYKNIGILPSDASYDAEVVINTKFLEEFSAKKLFADQQNRIKNSFNQQGSFNIAELESRKVVLAEDIQIHFDAQRVDFDFSSSKDEILENKKHLKQIAEQMEVLGTTVVKLVGHLDTTKVEEFKAQGQQVFIEASAQAKLISKKRAEYIKSVLVEKYGCEAARIITEGKGWDMPLDETDQTKNRRVEVRFLSFE